METVKCVEFYTRNEKTHKTTAKTRLVKIHQPRGLQGNRNHENRIKTGF